MDPLGIQPPRAFSDQGKHQALGLLGVPGHGFSVLTWSELMVKGVPCACHLGHAGPFWNVSGVH